MMFIFQILTLTLSLSVVCHALQWEQLERGDSIEIIAPAYSPQEKNIELAKEQIIKAGYTPHIPEDLLNPDLMGYSNSEVYRADHFRRSIQDPSIKAIWAIRGGRGASTLLPYLQEINLPSRPKLIIGYSDITALHLWATGVDWPSLHGVVLSYNQECDHTVNAETSLDTIWPILDGTTKMVNYGLTMLNSPEKNSMDEKIISSKIVGGNLSLIQRSIGTNTELNTKEKILFLEDTGEAPTRLYEMFIHLERSWLLDHTSAVILGNFSSDYQGDELKQQYEFFIQKVAERLEDKGIPLFQSDEFGHGPFNRPLPLNTPTTLLWDVSEKIAAIHVATNNP